MLPDGAFDLDYFGSDVRYGRGRVAELGAYLADRGFDDALVVCGSPVGANAALMDPLTAGLGDRLAGVFDGTTPDKAAESAYAGIDVVRDVDPDVLVGVGIADGTAVHRDSRRKPTTSVVGN